MKKVLILVLVLVLAWSCSDKNKEEFTTMMVAADFDDPSIIQNFTDDFQSFYDGRTEYKLKKVWNFKWREYVAQYSAGDNLHYYVGSLVDPWGMDGTTYIYLSPKMYGKFSLEMITNLLFKQNPAGYIFDYTSPNDGYEGEIY